MIIFCLFSLVTVIADTPDSLVFEYSAEYIKNKVGDKIQYGLKGGGVYPEEKGSPALASVNKQILTPIGSKIELRYTVLNTRTEREIPTNVQYYGETETRKAPERYTPPPVTINENTPSPHGNAIITINPFSFDGRNVKIRSDILIKIYFRGGKWISPTGYQKRNSQLFLNQIRGKEIKPSSIPKLRQGTFLYAKIKNTKDGLYEVTPADLEEIGINASSIDPEEIEILGGYDKIMNWRMDSLLAMDTFPGVLPAIYEVDGDGVFEEGERILFYAHSLSGWGKNKLTNLANFYYHPYTDTNVYWLRLSGENPHTMEEISGSGGENVTHFTDTIHLEEDEYTPLKSGLAWGWKELNTGEDTLHPISADLRLSFTTTNIYNNQAIIQVAFYPKTRGTYDIRISLNGESVLKSAVSQGAERVRRTVFTDTINSLTSGLNNLVITLETPLQSIIMDYIEVIYERELAANGNELFISQGDSLIRNYTVEGFTNNTYVLNIGDSRNPSLIAHTFSNGNTNFSTDSRKILLQSSPYSIEDISLADPTSLFQGGADWIVITPDQFVAQAARLKSCRKNHIRGIASPQARVIEIDDIYNNFSYGVKDPSAIKRFLYWTQENWNPPVSYVLLLGNGSYDEKNLTGTGKTSFIPIHTEETTIYQPPSSPYLNSNDCLDSWFVDFNEDARVPDIPIGRVTASNVSESKEWVDKLTSYENSTGEWRMKTILLADDAIKTNPYRSPETEKAHTTLMETLSTYLPDWIYRDKIYLMEYPFSGSDRKTKPAAQAAHKNSMSGGALAGFYLGHGNLRQLADEKALEIQDINFISNWRKTPFYYYGSCEVGYFERPGENCLAAYAALYKDGGNIVSIAAGRSTEYNSNGYLGRRIAAQLFNDSVPTAGDAFLLAISPGGHRSYTFFGDPATSILIDSVSINAVMPDTATGGKQLEIKGKLNNSAEKIFFYFTEASYDTVLDAEEGLDHNENGQPLPVTITKEGNTIFRGSSLIVDDSFSVKINIPYSIESDSGKISLYSRGEKEAYCTSHIYLAQGSLPEDITPPSIEFKLQDRFLKQGDLIPPSGKITLIVRDSSGLDLRAKTNLQVIINNDDPLFITDRFSYVTGSSTTGEVTFSYEPSTLSDSINFEVYAKDNTGNIAIEAVSFKIGEDELLWNVKNYPNPMKDKTVIVYHLSEEVPVEIRIFTIAGRLVKELSPGASSYGPNYVEWDGRDRKGRKVSNGIYYYAIKAGNAEPHYGKIAVIR